MWKAAFGGRSERGSTVGVDDTASTSSRRRRQRRSSNDDKSMISSTSRRTDGEKDRDRKRSTRHESGVSYGSAPIPRLTESAVNAFNANDDDDDIWEDEADLKSEKRNEHKRSGSRERRRKSSGRSERSRSRERDSKHKKSSGRSERSRSRERGGWTRKSSGRSERSRSRDREDRDDRDRKRKDEKSSRAVRPNGKSRVSEIVDDADAVSVMPSSFSIDQFPSANPSTVRFDEHTMSGALDSHVPNQFPGQNPSTYTKSDFAPNLHGAAADYYHDKGQSVKYQPGERALTPNLTGSSSVAAPSGSTKPTNSAKSTKQSSSSSSSVKPSRKSSRAVSPPATRAFEPAAVIGGFAAASAANHHMQARASTQYEPSIVSQKDFVHDRPAASNISAMPPSIISDLPPRPVRYDSEPPPTVGAASTYYYQGSEVPPSIPIQAPSTHYNPTVPRPSQSGKYPSPQPNNNTGKYAAAGVAAAGMAAYGMSQHNQQNEQSERHEYTQHTQYTQQTQYDDGASRYGANSSYGPHAPYTPDRPGPYKESASGALPIGMHHRHEHKGPISRLKDGFLNLLSSPEDVAKMEEYTEYIGVCKNCFDPRSSPYAGPRKHHYHPKKQDSFETLRRRSLERMQRRRSDESLRRTTSKVQKENRYYSSDRKSSSNAGYLAGGLAVAGAATAGAAMFNDRKNFDDTYSVKSGHRASSAIRRRGSNSSFESRRRSSRGRIGNDGYGHEEFITVRTKDGRVENRKVHRSRSGSIGRKSNWKGSATGGAALGAVAGAATTSRHRRRSSPDQVSLRLDERRYQSRSSSRGYRRGAAPSQHQSRSRSSSRSHSPGLGEIFGFSNPKPRRNGRRSPFGSYQDSRKEQRKRKEKGGFFTFSNGSASSSESGMAFGDINGSSLSRKSSGKRKVSKKSSDEKLNATLLGIGATAAALTAAQKFSKSSKQGRRPELGARREVRVSRYGPDGHKQGSPRSSNEGDWVDELPSGGSSGESALAFDDVNVRRKLSSRPSMDSVGSSTSSNDGLSAWGWRWGSKKQKKQRSTTPPGQRQHSMSSIAGPTAAGMAAGAVFDAHARRVPSDVGMIDNTAVPQAPLQYIEPQPLSDVGSRHLSMPGAFEDPPLRQPQPITPFQPSFTQGSPEDPHRPTAGPSDRPPMRRSTPSPTRDSKGSFMADAAFIGGASVATAGIIASQNRKASPGSVRFGFNGEQQEKFDRDIREEREREETERRRADRTRALKEEAERFAREEDEKRVLAERKRRQREEEDSEYQRQREAAQREEAYKREQARNAEEYRRREEQERQAEEEERQRFNDRQIREELERKRTEREERSRKKRDKSSAERPQTSTTSWKGPVAAGMAGALAGAVLDGALHKQGREQAEEEPRSRNASYSTQTFEPTNEHSGAPITDDDLVDPDFFKRRRSPADLRRYEELSDEKLDELTHEREDYYNMPSQSQKDFFMPKELLEKNAEGKERVADPYGDNEVDVYQTTGGEACHINGSDFGRHGKPPVVHQNIPKLNVIAPTPPHSTAGSIKDDKSAPPSPLAELQDADISSERANGSTSDDTAGEAEELTRHMPGGFKDSVDVAQQYSDPTKTEEPAWEPTLSKKENKKRHKAGNRESVIDSEPDIQLEDPTQDVHPPRSVSFETSEEQSSASTSKKDKKKKGKVAKQTSTFENEPAAPAVIVAEPEPEPEPEPVTAVEPLVTEGEFAPLSKKDKKKKGKKGISFDDFESTPSAQEPTSADTYFSPDASQDRAVDPYGDNTKEVDDFQPSGKKDKKKKGKKGSFFEGVESTVPVQELPSADAYFALDAPQDRSLGPDIEKTKGLDDFQPSTKSNKKKKGKKGSSFEISEPSTPVNELAEPVVGSTEADPEGAWEPPLSKEEQKKRQKAAKTGLPLEASQPSTHINECSMREADSEPATEVIELEAESSWEPPLSKKEKKKREQLARADTFGDELEFATPLEYPTEHSLQSRELETESAWEPPLPKKDKKKREKDAKNAFALDATELSTPTDELSQQDIDRSVPEDEAAFEPPLSKKEKKKREKEAQRQSLSLGGSPSETRDDPIMEQSGDLGFDLVTSSQEVMAEPEWEPPLPKKDKKKREKEAQKQSTSFDDAELKTIVDDLGGIELEREPEADAPWEPLLSKKDKKKREKDSNRQSVSFENIEPSTPANEFVEPEQSLEAEVAWEPPLSKKEQKKRDKEANSQGFGDIAAAVMTTAGVAAIADAVLRSPGDDEYSTGKKSKKSKRKTASYDESLENATPHDMQGNWDESSSDVAKDASAADREFPRGDTSSLQQEPGADDYFGSGDTKKSKKKKKRESGRFNEPATGSPLRSEVAFDDYLGDAVPTNGEAQSTGYGRAGRGPSYYDDDYPRSGSPREMSPDEMAQSTVSAPSLERRKSSKSKSKRRSGVYEEGADFDDNRSIHSAATEPATSSSKKEKKGGLFGLFSRKTSDGDKRDQSFLGERVEDLPPLPLSRQNSDISASGQEEQDHGTPASGEAVEQAVAASPLLQGASTSGSVYTQPVARTGNTDIWGDAMGDVSQQPDLTEGVWGDEEFADRPSLPREVVADQLLNLMSVPGAGATPARTGGPMTNVQEDFDDWFGSTDLTPKAPLLIKGKKGKKAKKGKAAQVNSATPASPVSETPKNEVAVPTTPLDESAPSTGVIEADKVKDVSPEQVVDGNISVVHVSSTEPPTNSAESTQDIDSQEQEDKADEPISDVPFAGASGAEQTEYSLSEHLSGRRPSWTPRPLSSTAVPLRFRPIPSSPSQPKERSQSFGSLVESSPLSPIAGSNKKPRPRSSEFREVRPLYLVSRNSKLEEVDERLPDLPESKPSSRASSIQGSEDWHSATEDIESPPSEMFRSPGSKGNLAIDLDQANRYRIEDEIMDTTDQTTPKASDFPQTVLAATRSHSKQIPQFYTWEDLAKDEEMHEAAARQAEGAVEPEPAPSSETHVVGGLGIEQADNVLQDAPARKSKKDKRKNNNPAVAALLAGGAAVAIASEQSDDTQAPTSAQESDASTAQSEETSFEGLKASEIENEKTTSDDPQSAASTADAKPEDLTGDAAVIVTDETADDFFSPSTTKKSKKVKKNRKKQSTLDDPVETPSAKNTPATEIPTEGAAAEYYAATGEAMAKENETLPAAPELTRTNVTTEAESAPADVEWASPSTSKGGKKPKKPKKQKAEAQVEVEHERITFPEAAEAEVPEALAAHYAATVVQSESEVSHNNIAAESEPASHDEAIVAAVKADAAFTDGPTSSVGPAVHQVAEKDAAAESSSRGWFSWPWGAKKPAGDGQELDQVAMHAEEHADTTREAGFEMSEPKEPLDNLAIEKALIMADSVDPAIDHEKLVAEKVLHDASNSGDLSIDNKALPEVSDKIIAATTDLPPLNAVSNYAEENSTNDKTAPVEPTPKTETTGEEQQTAQPAEDQIPHPTTETTEVADDFWGAPNSKKKKGKKGKNSGQSTPLMAEAPTPTESDPVEVPEKILPGPQESETMGSEARDVPNAVETSPKEEDSFLTPPSSKKKGKKGKKSNGTTEQASDEQTVETTPLAPEVNVDQVPLQEDSPDSGPRDVSEPPRTDGPEDTESFSTPPSTKKKGKKNKKGSAAVSTSWDDLVAEDTLIDTPDQIQAGEAPVAEPQEVVVSDIPMDVPKAMGSELVGPARELEADDMWAALPSKKKGKKGKKAAKNTFEPTSGDSPVSETQSTDDVAMSLDADSSDPAPSNQVDTGMQQQTETPCEQETLSELKPSERVEDTVGQTAAARETPAAEPEDFWAPPSKGKKVKNGKKARQDAEEGANFPSDAEDILTTEKRGFVLPATEDTPAHAPSAVTADEATREAPREADGEDLWGPPTKGKKAKKGKKNKASVDVSEPQPSAGYDVPTDVPLETVSAADVVPAFEISVEQDAPPEDDWSSLTTDKKGKKVKKANKAAFAVDLVTSAPVSEEAPVGEANVEVVTPVFEIESTPSELQQDAVAAESTTLPVEGDDGGLTADAADQSNDKSVLLDASNVASEIISLENTSEQPTPAEAIITREPDTNVPPEELPKDDSRDVQAMEIIAGENTTATSINANETTTTKSNAEGDNENANEAAPDFGPSSTKKSKKDKKKNKKSQAFGVDEPSDSTQPLVNAQAAPNDSVRADEPTLNIEPPRQEESKLEADMISTQERLATVNDSIPAKPTEDFGSFSTKKSKKDKKKAKKGKTAEMEEVPTPYSPRDGAAADHSEGDSSDPVPVPENVITLAIESEGAAADYYSEHPENVEPAAPAADTTGDKDISVEQPKEANLAEEVGPPSAKGKKDKKKAKKAATIFWDTPEEDAAVAGEERPSTAVLEENKLTEPEITVSEPAEEFGAFSTKSKKDKKKEKKASSSSWDVLEEDTILTVDEQPPAAAEEESLPAEPVLVDEFNTVSIKKPKKDKKKGKKTVTDPWDVADPDNAVSIDAATQPEPESEPATDPTIKVSRDILDNAPPSAEVYTLHEDELAQDPDVRALEAEKNAKDDVGSAFSANQSKKDRKKGKRSNGVVFDDFPEHVATVAEVETEGEPTTANTEVVSELLQDFTEPIPEISENTAPHAVPDAQATEEPSASTTEPLSASLESSLATNDTNTPVQESAATDASQDEVSAQTDKFDTLSTKKSMKDKKKAKKNQPAFSSWDEQELGTPADESPFDADETTGKTDEMLEIPEDAAQVIDAPEASQAFDKPATVLDSPSNTHEEEDIFVSSTAKKSKKDKKKAKKGQAALWNEPEVATPPVETTVDTLEPAITGDGATDFPSIVQVPDEISGLPETGPEHANVPEATSAHEDINYFSSMSTKKSKNDKKKAKKFSEASPWDNAPAETEAPSEQPSAEHNVSQTVEQSLDLDQTPVSVEDVEPSPMPVETPTKEDGEAFGTFSTKKSRKDKKKGKKAQETDWPTDDPAPVPADQQTSAVDIQNTDNVVSVEATEEVEGSAPPMDTSLQPQDAAGDDLWAVPTKKSKKDKKKGKKTQLEEEVASTTNTETFLDVPAPAKTEGLSRSFEPGSISSTELAMICAAETPVADDDLWGSVSTKKGKKDKKKSRMSKVGGENAIDDQSRPVAVEDVTGDTPATGQASQEDGDAMTISDDAFEKSPADEGSKVEPVTDPLAHTAATNTASANQSENIRGEQPDIGGTSNIPSEVLAPETTVPQANDSNSEEAKGMTELVDATIPGESAQDIDFAATLAAGLAESGFDPDLVVDDPAFHRRASPPNGVAEADPEEIFTTSSKKKKGKGKKARDVTLEDPASIDTPAPKDAIPDDFDAAISRGLQDSGFDPSLIASAGSSSQNIASTDFKDDEDEFSFAKANKKKKKGKKALADAAVELGSADATVSNPEQEPIHESSLDPLQAVDDLEVLGEGESHILAPVDEAKPDFEEHAVEVPPVFAPVKLAEAGKDEWAAPSKSNKKSKKDKKKQDHLLDVKGPLAPIGEPLSLSDSSSSIELQENSTLAPDPLPEEAPLKAESAGEEEWGAPLEKKRWKKGKKQQEAEWLVGESVATPFQPPAEQVVVDDQPDFSISTERPRSTPVEGKSAPAMEITPEDTEPPSQMVDDEWAAPPKKKKGKNGKKQQDTDWQDEAIAENITTTPGEPAIVEEQSEARISAEPTPTPALGTGTVANEDPLAAETEHSSPVGDDEWGLPSKKKKGKRGKTQPVFDLQDKQEPEPSALNEVVPVAETVDIMGVSPSSVPDVAEPVSNDSALPADVSGVIEPSHNFGEAPPVDLERVAEPGDYEWAALSSKKKKGKKGKKNQASNTLDENVLLPETLDTSVPGDHSAAPDAIPQDNDELAEPQFPSIAPDEEPVATGQPLAANEAIDDGWAAPSNKKDKKKKKKKGMDWSEPEHATEEAPRDLLEQPVIASVEVRDESGTLARSAELDDIPESAEAAETALVGQELGDVAEDIWAAPSKKRKGKKGKNAQDLWAESETPIVEAETTAAELNADKNEPSMQPEDTTTASRDVDLTAASIAQDAAATDQLERPVVEPAEEEWGLSSKKKGKKKQKFASTEPEVMTTYSDVTPDPVAMESISAQTNETSHAQSVPQDELTTRATSLNDEQAAKAPSPAEAITSDWALPIKKKGKKSKKAQLWTEDEPQTLNRKTSAAPEPHQASDTAEDASMMLDDPGLATERNLESEQQEVNTAILDTPAEQSVATVDEGEWGAPSKKKGKKNMKKGGISDVGLDPFIDTPIESSAPISTTDTAEVSAAEDGEPLTEDTFQLSGEMDVDEMDKAYKAYKKNKRKQKKLQAAAGNEIETAIDPSAEQCSGQQHSTSSNLDVPQEIEPVRQPSPLTSEEPSWSFAKLEKDDTPGDGGHELTRMTPRNSLTSRRSLEPLHLNTDSPPIFDQDVPQRQEGQRTEAPRSAHSRTASRDTPLEPTSRDRASYLFQSPAPFQEGTSNNEVAFRTPEQRGDASDYFSSRGVKTPAGEAAEGSFSSPPTGIMSPRSALHPILEECAALKRTRGDATNITPMEPSGKMLRRTETPKAIREKSLLSSASRDGLESMARSVSNPVGPFDDERSLKRIVSDTRSPSAMSNRSSFSATQHKASEERLTLSRASNRSVTPTLRRTNLSGDLRAASRTSNRRGESGSAVSARASPKTIPFEPPPTPPLNDEDEVGPGATRAADMAETFQGYGGVQVSQVSPTRPPSMRKRQSMHVMDLESKLEQLTSENRALQEAQQSRGLDDGFMGADNHGLQQALEARELELREKNNEIQHIRAMLEPMQQEINRLVQINGGLTEANRNLVDDNNGRYATLQNEHANVTQQWQNTIRELDNVRQEHSRLSNGMRDAVAGQLSTALAEKDHEIRKLKDELAEASDRIRALQVQIQSSKTSDFLNIRDEDYFDGACQKLCQHVQQWVLRFSKMSDNRICRLSSDLKDEKIEARLDNALLDGMDVDKLLGDRVRRRDVFMSVVMTMVWEYVFTRYLFGMDREQRQKLKALEKTLSEVGPPRAVAQWRATTLTLLAKRPAFSKQCALDTEAVAHEIFGVLSALLTPPSGSEQQLLASLTKVITVAVNLSVEMRTQRSEYIMLPPLQPEYDTNGDLVRKVHFNASLMNERSGLFTSNEALEAERAVVKIVLFPLVVKKGDGYGEGEEEIVVCPAQVLVHNDSGKSRKVVRVMSGAMEIDDPRRSKQSLISKQGSMQF